MSANNVFDAFADFYFAPIILVIGVFGNAFGMIILSRKNLKAKLHMTHVYMYLLASDMIYLLANVPLVNIHQS